MLYHYVVHILMYDTVHGACSRHKEELSLSAQGGYQRTNHKL